MAAQRLLIAESNEDLRLALAQALHLFHYVRCCGTGTEALQILREEKPDILVLDLMLPELDGLQILETLAAENIRPAVLALTTYRSYYLELSAYRLGVSYIMMKPLSLENIVHRVLDIRQHLRPPTPKRTAEQVLDELLFSLGIFPGSSGYPILQEVLLQMAADPENLLCKEVYLDTARRFHTTYSAVESTVRRMIDSHWDPALWQEYFPDTKPPAAKVFLKQMAWALRRAME